MNRDRDTKEEKETDKEIACGKQRKTEFRQRKKETSRDIRERKIKKEFNESDFIWEIQTRNLAMKTERQNDRISK